MFKAVHSRVFKPEMRTNQTSRKKDLLGNSAKSSHTPTHKLPVLGFFTCRYCKLSLFGPGAIFNQTTLGTDLRKIIVLKVLVEWHLWFQDFPDSRELESTSIANRSDK